MNGSLNTSLTAVSFPLFILRHRSCTDLGASVGSSSCSGTEACYKNKGFVGDASCLGGSACKEKFGFVASGSCLGTSSCVNNRGSVFDGSCIEPFSCVNNTGTINGQSWWVPASFSYTILLRPCITFAHASMIETNLPSISPWNLNKFCRRQSWILRLRKRPRRRRRFQAWPQ